MILIGRLHRLSSKFLLLTIPAVVVAALAFVAGAYVLKLREREATNLAFATQQAERDATLLSYPLWNVDEVTVQTILASLRQADRVRCIRLQGAAGVSDPGSAQDPCDDTSGLRQLHTEVRFIDASGTHVVGELQHWVDVSVPPLQVFSDLVPLLLQLVLLVMVLILCSVLAFRYTVRAPLQEVGASLRAFRERGERRPVHWDSADELGEFIREYNAGLERQATAERNLRAQLNFQMALHQTMPTPFVYFDQDLRVIDANPAFNLRMGVSPQAIDQPLSELLPGVDWDAIRALTPGAVDAQELVGVEVNGEDHGFSLACSPFLGPEGGVCGYVMVLQDITARIVNEHALRNAMLRAERALGELKQAQDSLVQAEKLASLGSLVAGIAHEINTPVGNGVTVTSHLTRQVNELDRKFHQGELKKSDLGAFLADAKEGCAILHRALHSAAEQIQRFKQVAVDQTSSQRRQFDLKQVVEDVVATHRPQLRHTQHKVEVAIPPNLLLDSYPGPLEQVVANCFTNALLHAFEGIAEGTIRISAEALPEERVRLVVADDGRGIPPENLRRVFDPFFTTRLGTGGSGLGMHLVYNIVTGALGGKVHVESEPGAGTRVVLELPLVAPSEVRDLAGMHRATID